MPKRYFVELSRKDVGLVSYFPGLEIKDYPDADWVEEVLVPLLEPVARRRSKQIQGTPITFWFGVRKTARRPSEIFLFMTSAHPGTLIEQAIAKALKPLVDGKINAGREPLPEGVYPCLQIFRGKLIRFYSTFEGHDGFFIGTICWKDNAPAGSLLSVAKDSELLKVPVPLEETDKFLAEARISDISNGEECRKFQQMLIPVAREMD